jgi:hypothetical protein
MIVKANLERELAILDGAAGGRTAQFDCGFGFREATGHTRDPDGTQQG